jgi:hypothetical protein
MKCRPTITVDGDFTRRQLCQLSTIALPSNEVGSCANRAVRPLSPDARRRSEMVMGILNVERDDDAQRPRPRTIMQRGVHHLHVAIQRHGQAARLGAN